MAPNPLSEPLPKHLDAACQILGATRARGLGITLLNKALFYADLQALLETGRQITDSVYVALPQGPVVDNYRDVLVAQLRMHGLAEQIADAFGAKPVVLRTSPKTGLDDRQQAILVARAKWVEGMTATAASDYSHQNPGWKVSKAKKNGTPINMLLALQQLVEADPWLEEPLTVAERASLESEPETSEW